MANIVLNKAPHYPEDDCPLYHILCNGYCQCESGYYDSRTFEFDKCPYCCTINDITPCV